MLLTIVNDDFGVGDQERNLCIQLDISHGRLNVSLRGLERCGLHSISGHCPYYSTRSNSGYNTKKVWSRFASTHWGSGRTLRMKYDRYSTLDDMKLVAGCDLQQYQRRAECLCRRPSLKFTRFQCWTTRKHFRFMSVKRVWLL